MERLQPSNYSGKDLDSYSSSQETETLVSLIQLNTLGGHEKLIVALNSSNGLAAVLVHPFYHDKLNGSMWVNSNEIYEYGKYKNRLRIALEKYQKLGLPLIVFEEESAMSDLQSNLSRIGITKGVTFVETYNAKTEIVTRSLIDKVKHLKRDGLLRATVSGSYLKIKDPRYRRFKISSSEYLPPVVQNYSLEGCAGYTVITFLNAGVIATPGFASYPGRNDPKRFSHRVS